MTRKPLIAVKDQNCLGCNFCGHSVACALKAGGCIGCAACVIACPQGARSLKPRRGRPKIIGFQLDGKTYSAEGPVSILDALCELGRATKAFEPGAQQLQALCGTGGCGSCTVLVDGVATRSCVTPLREGMEIVTDRAVLRQTESRRMVTLLRPAPHYHPSVFAHGCNYRCDLCHNWNLTFSGTGSLMTAKEVVSKLQLNDAEDYWIGISGGEPTLNRAWLIETIRHLRQTMSDSRIQLDTNASLLTPDYIDELVQAGITDVSPDLKALELETFMKVTGVKPQELARRYLDTSWDSVRYFHERYSRKVFMAVSLPCHPRLHSKSELEAMATSLVSINPELRVTLIEYQPAFRQRDWPFLAEKTMEQARQILVSAGLRHVIVQGGQAIPRAVDPLDISLTSED